MPGPCQHRKPDGSPCKATPQAGSAYCFFHDPARDDQRREARRKGAAARNRKPDPGPVEDVSLANVQDVAAALARTINDVRSRRLEPKTANAVAALAGQLLAALRGGAIEERLRRLEEELVNREHAGEP
jgi:hypothetical protein